MSVIQMPSSHDLASAVERKPGLLTVAQLKTLTGFGRTTIYDMVAAGQIPYLRIGTSIRFDPIVIARWLREHTVLAA
jgi:excisionase family DNA binding protein